MSWITKILLGVDVKGFRSGLANADAAMKKFSGQLRNLGGLIGATFIGNQIAQFTKQAIELGSQIKTVGQGFSRMGDDAQLNDMRKSTRGLVNDLELMKTAVQAGNFGIPIAEMGNLLDFAARRAAETGQEVDYLVNSIITGIGRKSPMILDNLGISTTRLKNEFHGATIEAQSIADVAAAVGKIADEELGKMGPPIQTAADQMARLGVHMDNFLAAVSKPIEITFNFVFGGLADFMDVRMSENVSPADRLAYLASYIQGGMGMGSRAMIYGQAMGGGSSQFEGQSPRTGRGFSNDAQPMGSGVFDQFPGPDKTTLNGLREYQKDLQDLFNTTLIGTPRFVELRDEIDQLDTMIQEYTKGVRGTAVATNVLAKSTNDLSFSYARTGEVMRVIPMMGNAMTENAKKIEDAYASLEQQVAAMNYVGQQFGQILTSAFTAAMDNGGNFFDMVKDGFKNYLKQILAMTAATTGLAIAIAFVTGGQNFTAAFNAIGGGMGLPFGFSEDKQLQFRISGFGADATNQRAQRGLNNLGN